MARHSKFKHYVSALPYAKPDDMLVKFRADMDLCASNIGGSLNNININLDGKRHYIPNIKGENTQKQYYKASLVEDKDGTVWPAVTFGSFSIKYDNIYFKPRNLVWQDFEFAKKSGNIREDLNKIKAYQYQVAESKALAQQQQAEQIALESEAQEAARQTAIHVWHEATTPLNPDQTHPYLVKKQLTRVIGDVRLATKTIKARLYSTKRSEWMNDFIVCQPGDLIIPAYNGSQHSFDPCNFQRITLQGEKRFLLGGKIKGTYHLIPGDNQQIISVEGWATGQATRDLSGYTSVVAWSAGNLEETACWARERFPDNPVIVGADNDWETAQRHQGSNPGLKIANAIHEKHGIPYALPRFDPSRDHNCSDWDDYRRQYGHAHAKITLKKALDEAMALWTRNNDISVITDEHDAANHYNMEMPQAGISYLSRSVIINPSNFEYLTNSGKPLPVIQNIVFMARQYGICIRYNKITKDLEITVPGVKYTLDNEGNSGIEELRNLCVMNGISTESLESKLAYIADQNPYNPILDWIRSKTWDGQDRLSQFIQDTIHVKEDYSERLRDILVSRWMVGAVALACNDGDNSQFMMKGILVFQGGQSVGKTSWFKSLVPNHMNLYLKDGHTIDPANKDTLITALKHWSVELGELDGLFRKADIAKVKAFVTQNSDSIRKPFARKDSTMPRRTAFFASVNDGKFLVDDTGNSRWWTVETVALNYKHDFDMQQVWAQCLALYESGYKYWLDGDEAKMLDSSNSDFETIDPYEEAILRVYDLAIEETETGRSYKYQAGQKLTSSEVLHAIGYDKPKRSDATRMGNLLGKLFGKQERTSKGRMYNMPLKRLENPDGAGC